MSKHTPTPWRQSITHGRLEGGLGVHGIASHDNINVAWVTACQAAEANAAFIVRAVNSHDALVEVLREILKALREDAPGTPLNNRKYDALGMQAYDVLRAAGVEP